MPINHADGTMFTAMVFCPIAAGLGAVRAGAGWFTLIFIPIGLAVGVGIFLYARKLVYVITDFGWKRASKIPKSWIQQVVFLPFFLIYIILPYAIVWGAAFGVFKGSIWLVRHF